MEEPVQRAMKRAHLDASVKKDLLENIARKVLLMSFKLKPTEHRSTFRLERIIKRAKYC